MFLLNTSVGARVLEPFVGCFHQWGGTRGPRDRRDERPAHWSRGPSSPLGGATGAVLVGPGAARGEAMLVEGSAVLG